MLRRPASGLPIESYVLRPISTRLPTVRLRKWRISAGSCHGSRLPMPITRSSSMAATYAMNTTSHGDRRFDSGVGVIGDQLEIFITKIEQRSDCGIEDHARHWIRRTLQLQFRLFEMIEIELSIAERVHEIAGLEARHLRDHQGAQGIRGDDDRHTQKDIGAALIALAGKPAFRDVELKKGMTVR